MKSDPIGYRASDQDDYGKELTHDQIIEGFNKVKRKRKTKPPIQVPCEQIEDESLAVYQTDHPLLIKFDFGVLGGKPD